MKALHVSLITLLSLSLQAMTTQEAHHLVSRTHFGVSVELLKQYESMEYSQAVHYVISHTQNSSSITPPIWTKEPIQRPVFNSLSDEEKEKFQAIQRDMKRDLKAWWYSEMLNTSSQLTEMMTLFWHNHFVSSLAKVRSAKMMYNQNVLFRSQALGSYKILLHAIIKNPAMLIYLDNTSNTKNSPNENLARELLELFSLGEGNYSEDDIKNVARALSGYTVNKRDNSFRFNYREHDFGEKEFLGESGRFDGDDIIRIILENDETAKFITRKMWRYFVSDTPDEDDVEVLATIFRESDYQIKPLLEAMLNLENFKKSDNYGSLIKSPIELSVGTLKSFGYIPKTYNLLISINRKMGQDLLYPPNVKGWVGYKSWINTDTLLDRHNFLQKAILKVNFPQVVPTEKIISEYKSLFLSTEPLEEIQASSYQSLIMSLLLDPAYQIK